MARVFFDTNILVYTLDADAMEKRERARAVLRERSRSDELFISTQVLQEFYVAATRKLGLEPLVAKETMAAFERINIVVVTRPLIDEAIDISILHRLSFWDSLIVAAAIDSRCESLLTEDLSDGQSIRGLRIVNPFS